MTQDSADRLVVGMGSVLGFFGGGFVGGNLGSYFVRGSEREKEDAGVIFGLLGAAVGSAFGAVVAIPKQADRCPALTSGAVGEFQTRWP